MTSAVVEHALMADAQSPDDIDVYSDNNRSRITMRLMMMMIAVLVIMTMILMIMIMMLITQLCGSFCCCGGY